MNYYIENDSRRFYCLDEDNQIAWSLYIIDAKAFDSEAEAEMVRVAHCLHFCQVIERNPPATFLYNNTIPKKQRLGYYDHTKPTPDLIDYLYKTLDSLED